MRYVVAVKQVPDMGSAKTNEDGTVRRDGVPSILNPYCEEALVRVLDVKEEGDTVTVVTMGPPQSESALRRCIELGADDAYLISDRDMSGSDTWATSRVLAAFMERYVPDADLYVFGRMATDGDTGQVPSETAELLGVQQFYYVDSIVKDGDGFLVTQDYSGFKRTCRAPRGSVVAFGTVSPNGPIPTVGGYIRGLDAKIERLGRVELGLGLYSVGHKGSKTKIVRTFQEGSTRKGMKVEISTPSKAAEIILQEVRK